jgi:hypothetical protein
MRKAGPYDNIEQHLSSCKITYLLSSLIQLMNSHHHLSFSINRELSELKDSLSEEFFLFGSFFSIPVVYTFYSSSKNGR